MIKETERTLQEFVDSLPKHAKVLDVGGAGAPVGRADYVIDIQPYEDISFFQQKDKGPVRFTKKTYVQHDICSRKPWPFADKSFDYVLCTHVLEDIRDPLWVCSEIMRVGKAGYIEVPSRLYETTFGLEVRNLSGASHHRWIIDVIKENGENILRFTFKDMYAHSKHVNKNRVKFDKNDQRFYLKTEWKDSFTFTEYWLSHGQKIFEFYLNRPITEKEKWKIYRQHQSHPFVSRWLRYFKNTNARAQKLFQKYSAKK